MQFMLKRQVAKVAHVNLREEKHGEESVLGCDVKVTADVPNTFLDQLSPTLRSSLYMAEGEAPGSQAPLVADATHLPVLRYAFLDPLKASGLKMPMAKVVFHASRKDESVAVDADVNELRLEPLEGGTVSITFRVQFEPAPEAVARVSAMLGREVKVSVQPNDAPETPPESVE